MEEESTVAVLQRLLTNSHINNGQYFFSRTCTLVLRMPGNAPECEINLYEQTDFKFVSTSGAQTNRIVHIFIGPCPNANRKKYSL